MAFSFGNNRLSLIVSFLVFSVCSYSQTNLERTTFFPKKTEFPNAIPPARNLWVFVMAGQSNMAGRGMVEPQDTVADRRILSINSDGHLILAKEPLHFYEPSMSGLDCGLSFARTLIKYIPDSISVLIIPTAVGGSAIDQWLGDSVHRKVKLLTNFREKMEIGLRYGQVKSILWHQGESDANPKLIPGYEEKLSRLFSIFRNYAKNPELPIVMGEIGVFADDPSNKILMNEKIRHFSASNPQVFLISTSDFSHKGDKLHFDSASQRKMGERMAEKFLNIGSKL